MGLKQDERRIRVIEFRCSGYTEAKIAELLGVSERTVRRDLKSSIAEEFVRELKRRQLKDIEESKDPKIRLLYRDKLLNKLMPKKVNQTVVGGKAPIILQMWKPEDNDDEKTN